MKLDGNEQGPKRDWAEWRSRRDKLIAKPRRGNAAGKLERLKRKAK